MAKMTKPPLPGLAQLKDQRVVRILGHVLERLHEEGGRAAGGGQRRLRSGGSRRAK